MIHENIKNPWAGSTRRHPMGMLIATVAALSTFYPTPPLSRTRFPPHLPPAREDADAAAFAYRHSRGPLYPGQRPEHRELSACFSRYGGKYSHPSSRGPSDVLLSCTPTTSRTAARAIGIDPSHRSVLRHGRCRAALYGPLRRRERGGSQDAQEIDPRAGFRVRPAGEGNPRREAPDGFRSPVHKNYDPRSKIIKKMADEVLRLRAEPASTRSSSSAYRGRVLRPADPSERRLTREITEAPAAPRCSRFQDPPRAGRHTNARSGGDRALRQLSCPGEHFLPMSKEGEILLR